MGKLNLLHHKSWHVYSKENRERVRKDEEAAAKEEQVQKERVIKAEQEARLEKLREASLRRKDLPENHSLYTNEHVNLFKELERHHGSSTIIDQKAIDQKNWEDKHTMFLGETKSGRKDSPWYNQDRGSSTLDVNSDKVEAHKRKKKERQEEKRKKREDPMETLKQLMESRKSSAEPPVSKKTSAKSSSAKSIDQLRQERLERELAERNRIHGMMNPSSVHSSRKEFYNSQFNPNLIQKGRK